MTTPLELTDEQRAQLDRLAEDLAPYAGSKARALDAFHRCLRAEFRCWLSVTWALVHEQGVTTPLELTDEQRAQLDRLAEDLAPYAGSKAGALDALHHCLRAQFRPPVVPLCQLGIGAPRRWWKRPWRTLRATQRAVKRRERKCTRGRGS